MSVSEKRMYELGDKFWEVWMDGPTVFTRFGKTGMPGQTRLKKESTAALAASTLDKMVAEKIRQGYATTTSDDAAASKPAPTKATTKAKAKSSGVDAKELAQKLAALTDDASHLVLADWLQSLNHPLGELITLHHAIANASSISKSNELVKAAEDLFKKHQETILGYATSKDARFVWHLGLLEAATVTCSATPKAILESLSTLLQSPVAQRIERVTVQPLPDEFKSVRDYDDSQRNLVDPWPDLKQVAALLPARVTHVELGGWPAPAEAAYVDMPSFTKVSQAFPNLRRLGLTGSHPRTDPGSLTLSKLEELAVRFAEPSSNSLYLLMASKLPKLERLTVWIGGTSNCELDEIYAAEERDRSDDDDDDDFNPYPSTFPAFEISHMPVYDIFGDVAADVLREFLVKLPKTLKHLGFQGAAMPRLTYETIVAHPVIDQLLTLDLSGGYMDDVQSRALIDGKKSLKRLKSIDVSNNRLSKEGASALTQALPNVHIGKQRTIKPQSGFLPLAWHSDEPDRFFMRYVAGKE